MDNAFIHMPRCAMPLRTVVLQAHDSSDIGGTPVICIGARCAGLLCPPGLRLFFRPDSHRRGGRAAEKTNSLKTWHPFLPSRETKLNRLKCSGIRWCECYNHTPRAPPHVPEFIPVQICGVKSMFQSCGSDFSLP